MYRDWLKQCFLNLENFKRCELQLPELPNQPLIGEFWEKKSTPSRRETSSESKLYSVISGNQINQINKYPLLLCLSYFFLRSLFPMALLLLLSHPIPSHSHLSCRHQSHFTSAPGKVDLSIYFRRPHYIWQCRFSFARARSPVGYFWNIEATFKKGELFPLNYDLNYDYGRLSWV